MVMEASGSSERKYCHRRGGGQRLMRTSRRLMERSTERLTTTGTNSEPPCCRPGGESGWDLAQPAGGLITPQRTPEPSSAGSVPQENPAGHLCDQEPTSLPRGPQGGVCRGKGPELGVGGLSSPSPRGARTSKLSLAVKGSSSPTESMLSSSLRVWASGGRWSRTGPEAEGEPPSTRHVETHRAGGSLWACVGPSQWLREAQQGTQAAFPMEERPAHTEPSMQGGEAARGSEGFHRGPPGPGPRRPLRQCGSQGLRAAGPEQVRQAGREATAPSTAGGSWRVSPQLLGSLTDPPPRAGWAPLGIPGPASRDWRCPGSRPLSQTPVPWGREAAGAKSAWAVPHSSHTPASWAGAGAWTQFLPPVLPAPVAALQPGPAPRPALAPSLLPWGPLQCAEWPALASPGPAGPQGPPAPRPVPSGHTRVRPAPRILLLVISCHLFSRLSLGASRSMRETASSSVIPSSR